LKKSKSLSHKDLIIKGIAFGISFYLLEVFVYFTAMTLGPGQRKILGLVSLHDIAGIITFPLVYLTAEQEPWLGRLALILNAILWATAFAGILALLRRYRRSSL
jgi:hypothetical protein